MTSPTAARPLRLLIFWPASDFDTFLTPAFLNRPEYKVELVSGNRSSGPSPHAADSARLRDLRQRLKRGEFDLVLSGTIWNTPWPPHKQLATRLAQAARFLTYKKSWLDTWWAPGFGRLAREADVPFAVVDLRDACFVYPWDWPLLRESFLYFKRELFHWRDKSLDPIRIYLGREVTGHEAKLRPLSYGITQKYLPDQIVPFEERTIDVLFTGSLNPLRRDILPRLERLGKEFNIEIHTTLLPFDAYYEKLRHSKLVLCVESYGCETWRMYEASGAGSVPLVNWPYVQNAFPLEPDRHAVYYSYIGDDLEQKIRSALAQPEKLKTMSQATHEFTRQHKDRARLADYIVETSLREFAAQQSHPATQA